jgi:hypothetical protein
MRVGVFREYQNGITSFIKSLFANKYEELSRAMSSAEYSLASQVTGELAAGVGSVGNFLIKGITVFVE